MFTVNSQLLDQARAVLAPRPRLFWLIGSACAGKSTISRALAARYPLEVIDMDGHIYGDYFGRYDPVRHPANTAWMTAPNPLAWALAMSLSAYDAFNRAANAEYLDLLAADLASRETGQPLLIDGGFTHPSILAQVVDPKQIVCLATSDADRVRIWESAPARAEMRSWIQSLPQPEEKWRQFLACDADIAHTMQVESDDAGILIQTRAAETTVDEVTEAVAAHWCL